MAQMLVFYMLYDTSWVPKREFENQYSESDLAACIEGFRSHDFHPLGDIDRASPSSAIHTFYQRNANIFMQRTGRSLPGLSKEHNPLTNIQLCDVVSHANATQQTFLDVFVGS